MSIKKTAILAMILAVLVAFIYLVERPRSAKQQEQKNSDAKVLDVDWDKVTSIRVREGKNEIGLAKDGDHWKLTEPIHDRADKYAVESLINGLRYAVVERRLKKDEVESLGEFGLATPRVVVEVTSDNITRTLQIGNNFGIGTGLYVKEASSPEVVLTGQALFNAVMKKSSDLRDRDLFRDPGATPIGMIIEQKNQPAIELVKQEKPTENPEDGETEWAWKMVRPYTAGVDNELIDKIADKAMRLRISDFTTDRNKSAPLYGLDNPEALVTFVFPSDSKDEPPYKRTLRIGRVLEVRDLRYVFLDGFDHVVLVNNVDVDEFFGPPERFRDRHLLALEKEEISKIDLHLQGRSAMISHLESSWIFEDGKNVDADAVQKLIAGLFEMESSETTEASTWELRKRGINKDSPIILLYDGSGALAAEFYFGDKDEKVGARYVANTVQKPYLLYKLAVEELAFWPQFKQLTGNVDNTSQSETSE